MVARGPSGLWRDCRLYRAPPPCHAPSADLVLLTLAWSLLPTVPSPLFPRPSNQVSGPCFTGAELGVERPVPPAPLGAALLLPLLKSGTS